MALWLTAPNSHVELRRLVVDAAMPGEAVTIDVDMVASAAHAEARMAASESGWIWISTDNGASYAALGTDVRTGLDLGPQTAGQRTRLRIKVAPTVPFRQRRIQLYLGEGL